MPDTVVLSGNRILSFIERIERIDEELKELSEGKKEVLNEAGERVSTLNSYLS